MTSNKKLFNYKVVDRIEGFDFDINFISIRVHMKKLWIIFWYKVFRSPCFDPDETQNQV